MPTFQITLKNDAEGLNETITVADNQFILDAAEEAGINLAYSCRAGACATCVCRTSNGASANLSFDSGSSTFLTDTDKNKGYVLICSALPKANVTILTGKEEEFYS